MTGNSRYVRSLIAAAGMLTGIAAINSPALGQQIPSTDSSAAAQLKSAQEAAASGKVVRARNILQALNSPAMSATLSDAEHARVIQMLTTVSRRVKDLSPVNVSLQTAEECLAAGDLRTAEHHCRAVVEAPKATNEEVGQARAIMARANEVQAEIAPKAQDMLDAAIAAYESEDYAGSKSTLDSLVRSGVKLDAEQTKLVESYQNQIVDLEHHNGRAFRVTRVDAAMFQPGVVKRRQPTPPPAEPTPAPAAEVPVKIEPAKVVEPAKVEPAKIEPAKVEPAKAAPAPMKSEPVVVEGHKIETPAPVAQPEPTPAAPAPAPAAPAQPEPADPIVQAQTGEMLAQLAEADAAFEAARYSEASNRYSNVLGQYGTLLSADQKAHCEMRLQECRARQSSNSDNLMAPTLEQRKVAREAAVTQYKSYLTDARKALETGDPDAARSHMSAARLTIRSANQLFAQSENEAFDKELADLKADVDKQDAEIEARTRDEQARQQKKAAEIAASEAASARSRKISEAIGRVRSLQSEQKYAEALQVTDEILFMDPINPTGLLLRDVLTDLDVMQRYAELRRRKRNAAAEYRLSAEEATIVGPDVMNFPDDWPKLSARRGEPIAFADAEENRRTLALVETKKIPAEFNEQNLDSVLKFIKTVAAVDVDVDWQSLDAVGINKETPISLTIGRVTIAGLLNKVLERASQDPTAGAAWTIKDGMVFIASREVINRERVLAIYDIKDLLVVVPNFEEAPEFNLQTVLQSSQGGGGQSPFQDQGGQQEEDRVPLEERTQELIDIITTNVDNEGWQENGGETGYIQQFQGNLIITQTPANHREIRGLLTKLREQRAMQVNVEARFLLVSQSFFEQIGFDLDVYWNGDNNQVRAARAAAPGQQIQPSDFFDFTRGGLQRRVSAPAADTNGDGQPDPGASSAVVLPSPLSVIGTPQNSLGLAELLTQGEFATTVLGEAPALGIGGQFLDDIQVDFLVKATQADRRAVTLTAPRLTFTNSQRAWVAVATQIAFVSDLQPIVSDSAVGFDPDLDVVSEGVVLDVEGTISADRRYVFLTVQTAVSKIEGFNQVGVTAVAGGQLVNSADTQSFIQTPTVTVTEVNTSVTVPDQGTILLGGQRLITEGEVETGVPVLSKIPILNRFFTNRTETKEEQTLLILIKPTILIQTEEEERHFPGLEESMKFMGH